MKKSQIEKAEKAEKLEICRSAAGNLQLNEGNARVGQCNSA